MAEVSFSNAAVADLSAIDEYSLAQFGEETGEAYMHGFDEEFVLLQEYPLAGRAAPEYGRAYRCLVHRRHRIFYVVKSDMVWIVRILHHAMDAKRALKGAGK
ncbi:MAG: type II toxin-antitoxin system RelE/ParE family toxin [Sphingopyxis sp.]